MSCDHRGEHAATTKVVAEVDGDRFALVVRATCMQCGKSFRFRPRKGIALADGGKELQVFIEVTN